MMLRNCIVVLLAACCLLGLLRAGQCEEPGSQDFSAAQLARVNQAFDRADYPTAAAGYARLLKQFPHSSERERILADYAWCCLKLNKTGEAVVTLQLLFSDYPDSPYGGEALATLYQYALSLADTPKSNAVWALACTAWQDTPFAWAVVREHYKYLAQQPHPTPEQLTEKFADIFTLPGFAENMGMAVYLPLIQGKRIPDAFTVFDGMLRRLDSADPATALAITTTIYQPLVDGQAISDALKAHELVQALLKGNNPTLARREQAVFDDLSARNPELAFARFKQALQQGDMTAANQWTNKLEMIDWQHPRTIEARRLLQESSKQ